MFEIMTLGCEMFDDGLIHTVAEYRPKVYLLATSYNLTTNSYKLGQPCSHFLPYYTGSSLYNLVATSYNLTTSSYKLVQPCSHFLQYKLDQSLHYIMDIFAITTLTASSYKLDQPCCHLLEPYYKFIQAYNCIT